MEPHNIPSLRKALQLVQELAKANYSQAELSRNLNITMSTTYRILCTLMAEGWILKRSDARYMLGGGMLPLLSFFHRDISHLSAVKKIVEEIPAKTGLFGRLSVRDGLRHVEVYRSAPAGERMRLNDNNAGVLSIIDGPSGVALLADESPENVEKIYARAATQSANAGNVNAFVKAVAECRKKGYSLQKVGNSRWDVMVMAVPVYRGGRIVAALSGCGAVEDFSDKKVDAHAAALKKIAQNCAKILELPIE